MLVLVLVLVRVLLLVDHGGQARRGGAATGARSSRKTRASPREEKARLETEVRSMTLGGEGHVALVEEAVLAGGPEQVLVVP